MPQAEAQEVGIRELSGGMRRLLWIAGFLVLLAGSTLFILTEQTESFLRGRSICRLRPPFSELATGRVWRSSGWPRERAWIYARIAVPSVFVFTTLTLIATLIHLELFHLGSSFPFRTHSHCMGLDRHLRKCPRGHGMVVDHAKPDAGERPGADRPAPSARSGRCLCFMPRRCCRWGPISFCCPSALSRCGRGR